MEEKNHLNEWLRKGNHAEMNWMEKRKDERGNIHSYFPAAKSVISLGMNYRYKLRDSMTDHDSKIILVDVK